MKTFKRNYYIIVLCFLLFPATAVYGQEILEGDYAYIIYDYRLYDAREHGINTWKYTSRIASGGKAFFLDFKQYSLFLKLLKNRVPIKKNNKETFQHTTIWYNKNENNEVSNIGCIKIVTSQNKEIEIKRDSSITYDSEDCTIKNIIPFVDGVISKKLYRESHRINNLEDTICETNKLIIRYIIPNKKKDAEYRFVFNGNTISIMSDKYHSEDFVMDSKEYVSDFVAKVTDLFIYRNDYVTDYDFGESEKSNNNKIQILRCKNNEEIVLNSLFTIDRTKYTFSDKFNEIEELILQAIRNYESEMIMNKECCHKK